MTEPRLSWEQFCSDLATIADAAADEIQRDTRLIADLALDSLALAEVVAMLVVDYDVRTLANSLEERDWTDAVAGDLYSEYVDVVERVQQLEGR